MKHYDEDMIDFPVADCWRDHYAAQGLTYPAGRREPPPTPAPAKSYSDQDGDGWARVGELMATIGRQRAEMERLKANSAPRERSRENYDGVE